jgi:recombination protein RecA
MAIREKAGVISKKIEGNPLDPEKIAKDQAEQIKEEENPSTKKN